MAYPVADLYGEMAFIAAHFHWSSETLMTMAHGERRRWCREISRINRTPPKTSWRAPRDHDSVELIANGGVGCGVRPGSSILRSV
ncbi:MAG TPA: DUF6760 family protein [Beijerinckiaceae bacterium]|nr:DUF6760 family protein [Beijerinckiaceae bacterium]